MAEPVIGWTEAAYTGLEVMAGDKGGGLAGDNVSLTLNGVRNYIQPLSGNVLSVGDNAQFASVTLAIAQIATNADAALDNPYTINVAAGTYADNFILPSFVHVVGQSRESTRFVNTGKVSISGAYCSLNSLYISRNGAGTTEATVQRAGWTNQVQINDCYIEALNRGTALDLTAGVWTGDELQTWFVNNTTVIAKETGVKMLTAAYFRDCTIIAHDENAANTWDIISIFCGGARPHFWNCNIGQGYNNPQESQGVGPESYEVFGDRNLYGLYLDDSIDNAGASRNSRVEMFGCRCYTRNETDTTLTGKDINAIYVVSGWLRTFGSLFQSETPGSNINKLYAAKIISHLDAGVEKSVHEDYASRISRETGTAMTPKTNGFQTLTVADDTYRFNKFEGGVKLLDTTGGAFTLQMPLVMTAGATQPVSEVYQFVQIDGTNIVTLSTTDGNGGAVIGYGGVTTLDIAATVGETVKVCFHKDTNTWVVL